MKIILNEVLDIFTGQFWWFKYCNHPRNDYDTGNILSAFTVKHKDKSWSQQERGKTKLLLQISYEPMNY